MLSLGLPVLTLSSPEIDSPLLWSGSSTPAIPCIQDSVQQKKKDQSSPISYLLRCTPAKFLLLSLVRTRNAPTLIHWDCLDWLWKVWIYLWAKDDVILHKHGLRREGCQEGKGRQLTRQQ